MDKDIITSVIWDILRYPLPNAVGGSGVSIVDLLTCTVETKAGQSGFGFSYVIGGGAEASLVAGRRLTDALFLEQPVLHPEGAWAHARRLCNRTGKGPNYVGYAAADMALWDLHAHSMNVSLAEAMGGTRRAVPVYGSGGYRPGMSAEATAEQVSAHLDRGFRAIKLRLAGDARDEIALKAAASVADGAHQIMADLNEKGTLTTAKRALDRVAAHGGSFVEEPLPAHDYSGYRQLSRSHAGQIATGEHLQGVSEALPFMTEGLSAVIQPDLAMIGGLTEALRVARIAEATGTEVMPHFLPGLFVHLAAAAPSLTWLEEFPLLEPLFTGWPEIAPDGMMAPRDVAGHGLTLIEDARARYRLS